jgi:hypothetical protein
MWFRVALIAYSFPKKTEILNLLFKGTEIESLPELALLL